MELTCYLLEGHEVEIQPAASRREWMDETPKAYAYRCLPLTMANAHGWEIRCPIAFEAEWNGGPRHEDVEIFFDEGAGAGHDGASQAVASHFGSGILTFVPSIVLRTPPGYNLWVSGPANLFKDGVQALSANIETDWMPYTFTVNWKITRPNLRIRFEKGEPYCFFYPIKRSVVESCEPVMKSIFSEPELVDSFECAYGRRLAIHDTKNLAVENPKARKEVVRASNWYMRGLSPDGSQSIPEHQRIVRAKPFQRRTKNPS